MYDDCLIQEISDYITLTFKSEQTNKKLVVLLSQLFSFVERLPPFELECDHLVQNLMDQPLCPCEDLNEEHLKPDVLCLCGWFLVCLCWWFGLMFGLCCLIAPLGLDCGL
jgi:hypothetical protein